MKKAFVAIALFAAISAVAGPLGLSKGMTLEEIKRHGNFTLTPEKTSVYSSPTLTNGHPDFERYTVILTPQHGLCKIMAIGKDVSTSVYGSELRSSFEGLSNALSTKYGKSNSAFNFLQAGSIWNEPNEWMMGLFKKERTLSSYWYDSKKKLPDSIHTISLSANALATSKGWITLNYEFDNVDDCIDLLQTKKNSNL